MTKWGCPHPGSCEGKVAHKTRADALAAIERMSSRGHIRPRAGRRDVTAYKCRFCGLWHIGSDTPC